MNLKLNDPYDWHNLFQQLTQESDPLHRERVILEIINFVNSDPYIELLRLTFLSEFLDSDRHNHLAGLAAQQQKPINIECLTAVAALGCMRPIAEPNRERFFSSIMNAQLPEIISMLNHFAEDLVIRKMKARIPEGIDRVMIIPSYFANPMHTPSMLTVNYATIFHQLGCRVFICAPQELKPTDMKKYHGAGRVVNLPTVDFSSWPTLIPKDITTYIVNEHLSMEERYSKTSELAAQFDPDLILCVGPYSPIASALYSVRPVLALPTNTASFLGSADVWLRGSDLDLTEDEITWGQQFPLSTSVIHPYRISSDRMNGASVTRQQLGIREDAVVLVTVGFRLSSEITTDWANRITDIINADSRIVWILIGDVTPECLKGMPAGKIINLGIQSRAIDYLEMCDIYVNPPRMGGGFSVLEAMSKACAVLAYADSDGGEKIGASAVKNDAQYFARLHEFILNPKSRLDQGQQLAQRFHALYDLKNSESSLINACRLAVELSKKRFKSLV